MSALMIPERKTLSASETIMWCDLVRQRCGIDFPESRLRVLNQCLSIRMGRRRMTSVMDYYYLVAGQACGGTEWAELVELLLNKETSFFRHAPSFEALRDYVLPRLRARRPQEPLRVWSAGCSTGQEAYSLAMTIGEVPEVGGLEVLGGDLSPVALERARAGRYRSYELREVPGPFCRRYFRPEPDQDPPAYRIASSIRSRVRFQPCNLVDAATYPEVPQDVIYCQNVLIYFAPECRSRVIRQLAERLHLGGYLFLGPAEAVGTVPTNLEPIHLTDVTILQRRC